MDRKQGLKIIRKQAVGQYHSTTIRLLEYLHTATFKGNPNGEVEVRIKRNTSHILKAIKVKECQLYRIVSQLEHDGVLADVERENRTLHCRLNLKPLAELPVYDPDEERKKRNTDRAAKAREERTQIRSHATNLVATCIAASVVSGMVSPAIFA